MTGRTNFGAITMKNQMTIPQQLTYISKEAWMAGHRLRKQSYLFSRMRFADPMRPAMIIGCMLF
jgi:hypothetical protein